MLPGYRWGGIQGLVEGMGDQEAETLVDVAP